MAKAFGRNKVAKHKITPKQFLDMYYDYATNFWFEHNEYIGSKEHYWELTRKDFAKLSFIKDISILVSKEFYDFTNEKTTKRI